MPVFCVQLRDLWYNERNEILESEGLKVSTIQYISTRDTNNRVTASQAILKGIAEDGGLYVPTALQK